MRRPIGGSCVIVDREAIRGQRGYKAATDLLKKRGPSNDPPSGSWPTGELLEVSVAKWRTDNVVQVGARRNPLDI